jgi:hypothetical protein
VAASCGYAIPQHNRRQPARWLVAALRSARDGRRQWWGEGRLRDGESEGAALWFRGCAHSGVASSLAIVMRPSGEDQL